MCSHIYIGIHIYMQIHVLLHKHTNTVSFWRNAIFREINTLQPLLLTAFTVGKSLRASEGASVPAHGC